MDDAAFNSLISGLGIKNQQAPVAPAPQLQPQQQASLTGPNGEDISAGVGPNGETDQDRTPAPAAPVDDTQGGMFPKGGQFANPNQTPEPGLSDPSAPFIDAPIHGAAKAIYQTKDFVLGETPMQDRSSIRKFLESDPTPANASPIYALSEGIAQFGVGLMGAGKILEAAKGVKAAGSAIEAFQGVRGGAAAVEAAKASATGAVVFDPHQARISNLIQGYPALANPVNAYLAAKPDDSAAMGRLKNAVESLGLDAAGYTLMASLKLYKGIKDGDVPAVKQASAEVQKSIDDHPDIIKAQQDAANPSQEPQGAPPAAGTDAAPQGQPAPAEGQPAGTPPVQSVDPDGTVNLTEIQAGQTPPAPAPETHTDLNGNAFTKDKPGAPWMLDDKSAETDAGAGDGDVPSSANMDAAGVDGEAQSSSAPDDATLSEPELESVDQVKNATQGAGAEGLPPKAKLMDATTAQAESLHAGAQSDMAAFQKYGDWDNAIDNGHIFGKGGSIPYQKLAGGQNELGAFITRASETFKESLDKAKGGNILGDARVQQLVKQRTELYGEDPAALMGLIQSAGKDANSMVANMEASYVVAQRAYQDAYTLSTKIRVGALDEYGGSHDGAMEALRQRLMVANTAWGAGQSMRSSFGRGMRRLRADFRPDQQMLDALKGMDDGNLVTLLNSTGGDPRVLRTATQPGLLARAKDAAQFLYVNNLLWGLRTHFVNFSMNAYMAIERPAQRILGSLVQSAVASSPDDAAAALKTRREALATYQYIGSSLGESWKAAKETWVLGDSVSTPHNDEFSTGGVQEAGNNAAGSMGSRIAQMPWRPINSLQDLLYNTFMVAAPKTIGIPTRTIGAADEMLKQVVYRSKVQSKAFVEAMSQGMEPDAAKLYVKNALFDSFDDAGRMVDADALAEAHIATFQQDLIPGTLGATVQNAASNSTWVRFIVPFVKTPTNVIRLGVKMTPGLNLVQTEYRSMLKGAMGPEAQAQAIGQMGLGAMYMGFAAYLAHTGMITGGWPSDPKAKAALAATGWQPYSFVRQAADGSRTYINFGRYDPVAMPLGMVADVHNILSADPDSAAINKAGSAAQAILVGLVKSISEKSYLKSLDDTIQAITDPDTKSTRYLGTMAANMIPGSAGLRFVNQTAIDPTMREARSFVDYIHAGIPGWDQTLPPKRDAFGDPVSAHPGLWTDSKNGLVDGEVRRMAEKPGGGSAIGPPSPKYRGGVDLRDVTMADGSNAYDKLQQLARKPTPDTMTVKDAVAKIIQSPAYARAPDGDPGTQGTKMAMITGVMSKYRAVADRMMLADPNVRTAAYKKLMEVKASYASAPGAQNPTPANQTSSALTSLQNSFGSALGSLGGSPQ